MFLQLDNQGPRYAQLTRALKQAILSGRCAPSTRLPATRTLARELDLSRNTVLAAYEQLAAEGFIEGRVGSGCYVSTFAAAAPAASGMISFKAPTASELAARKPARREPRVARRGQRMRELYEVKIPGRQHRGLRYNLQYGMPMTNPQLASAWRRELSHAAAHMVTDYPDPQGLPALREQVCDYLARRRGIVATPDDILIVSGTQQAFALAAEVLLDEGDKVVIEDPHYQGARQILQAAGAELVGCRVDGDGMVVAELPERSAARLALVTPSHQFPTGAVLSLARRMELLAWAEQAGCWLIEDDYDGEFRYDARPLAALKSLDRAGQVIYIGTFSKVLFPALRLGYMVLPPRLRDAFVAGKWLTDRGCPAIEQAALARLMATGAFERHLRATGKALKLRRAALLDALRRHAGDAVEVADSSAGMHVLAWLPRLRHGQVRELIERARARGLGLYPIAPYYLKPQARSGLLLGYADLPPADLDAAMRIFGECLRAAQVA
ncbi:MAG TPA: PLP-dependent aminotransferase family protein [Rudaea sp.]|nr:PLP-dependent aminotransferase family protein [Rudaea sp.]